jgi:hypothetical protein
VTVQLVRKKTFGREEVVGATKFPLNGFATTCVVERTLPFKLDGGKTINVGIRGTMRTPIESVEVQNQKIIVFISTNLLPQSQGQPVAGPPPAPQAAAAAVAGPARAPPKAQAQGRQTQVAAAPEPVEAVEPVASSARRTQAPPPKMPYILKDWEWEGFFTPGVLDHLQNVADLTVKAFKSRRMPPPDELTRQIAKIEEKRTVLEELTATPEEQLKLVTDQIAANAAKERTLAADDPTKEALATRRKIMEDELAGDEEDE